MNLPEDGDEPRLELTYNHGRTEPYEIGTGYGHIAITTATSTRRWRQLAEQGIEPERPPYTSARAATACASCATPTATGSRSSSAD